MVNLLKMVFPGLLWLHQPLVRVVSQERTTVNQNLYTGRFTLNSCLETHTLQRIFVINPSIRPSQGKRHLNPQVGSMITVEQLA